MNFIFSDRSATLDGLGDQRNGSIATARNAVICGGGLENELYILHRKEASINVIHGTSPAAAPASHVTRENHPSEENREDTSAIDGDLEHSAWLLAKIQLLSMELELLQAENRRTKAAAASESLADKRELQTARVKIKNLKRRMRASRAQARKKKESLDRKIAEAAKESEEIGAEVRRKMKEREDMQNTADMLEKANLTMNQESMELEQRIESAKMVLAVLDDPEVIGRKMKELEDLEDSAEELGRTNLKMKQESKELEQRIESAKMQLSVLEHPPSEALEEINRLRESNAKLQKKIGKLEAKQKADDEELSQLRWFNMQLSEEFFRINPTLEKTKAGNKDRNKEQQQQPKLSDSKRATTGHALPDSGEKIGSRSAPSSMYSDERVSTASSCATADDQLATSPVAGSGADADERWSSKSAWINGAFHRRYPTKPR